MLDEEQKVEVGYVPDDGEDIGSANDAAQNFASEAAVVAGKKASHKKVQHELDKVQKELVFIKQERDELKDKYLRTLADFDNFRKRMRREKEDYQQYHLSDFLLELLPVFDNLERALRVQKDVSPSQSVLSGVEMIFKLLVDILKRFGVEEVLAKNVPFDPTLHQALSKCEDSAVSEAVVTEVYQRGFFYNGRLLRPALVRVSLPVESSADTVTEKEK